MLGDEGTAERLDTLERQMKRLLSDRSIGAALDGAFALKWPSRIIAPEGDTYIIVREAGGALSTAPIAEYSAALWSADASSEDTSSSSETVYPSITMPATAFIAATATPDLAVRGSGSDYKRVPGWALDASTDESVTGVVFIPAWAEFTVAFYLAFSSSASGDVFMGYQLSVLDEGDQIDETAGVTLALVTSSPSVADQLVVEEFTNQTAATGNGAFMRVNVYRTATSGADTYAADVWFLGAVFTQTA